MGLLVKFPSFGPPKSMFKFINAETTSKSASEASAQIFLELFDFVCHVCCFLDLFKVKNDVCVRYNIIFAYCVPTLCVLRTV